MIDGMMRFFEMVAEASTPEGSHMFDEMMQHGRDMGLDDFDDLPEVAPGVLADINDRGQILFINTVWSKDQGAGNVGRWLDSLSDRHVVVPAVISSRFAGMLERRGYVHDSVNDNWSREP